MTDRRSTFSLAARALVAGLLLWTGAATAQAQDVMKGRLAPVPVDGKSRPTTGGFGNVTATLAGTKLTVSGTYNDFVSPATIAQLHQSKVIGVRGPVAFDLTITKGTSGSISGTFDLNPQQVEAAKKGLFYVQIHSEKAPEGNVWGWLLK